MKGYEAYGIPDYAAGFIQKRGGVSSGKGGGRRTNAKMYDVTYSYNYNNQYMQPYPPPHQFNGAVNGSAIALLGFLFLLNQAQVNIFHFRPTSRRFLLSPASESTSAPSMPDTEGHASNREISVVEHSDIFPDSDAFSVMGIDSQAAVGFLGLLLFINLLRVNQQRDAGFASPGRFEVAPSKMVAITTLFPLPGRHPDSVHGRQKAQKKT